MDTGKPQRSVSGDAPECLRQVDYDHDDNKGREYEKEDEDGSDHTRSAETEEKYTVLDLPKAEEVGQQTTEDGANGNAEVSNYRRQVLSTFFGYRTPLLSPPLKIKGGKEKGVGFWRPSDRDLLAW